MEITGQGKSLLEPTLPLLILLFLALFIYFFFFRFLESDITGIDLFLEPISIKSNR